MNKRRSRRSICMALAIALLIGLGLGRPVYAAEQTVVPMEQGELPLEQQPEYPEVLEEGALGGITPYFNYTVYIGAWINFNGSTAYLDASVDGYESRTTQINGFLYLQKKVGNEWWTVKTWTGSANDWYLDMHAQWPYLTAGNTYRTRFVAIVYQGSNHEQVEACSDEEYYSGN